MLRVHSVPHSPNVDRVALAAGLKGLQIEWIEHPYDDRAALLAATGQSLAPVLDHDGAIIADSPLILRYLDEIAPEPLLWPADDDVLRARVEILVEWFNSVWKGPPNALEALWAAGDRTSDEAIALAAQTAGWSAWFDGLLAHGEPYLLGDRVTAADVVIYPFLQYASLPVGSLPYLFEEVIQTVCGITEQPRVMAWIARMDELPRA